MAISPWLSGQLLRASLTGQSFAAPANLYLALFNGDPLAGGNEVSGGGYARQPIAFEEVQQSTGYPLMRNNATITFPVATTTWDLITHLSIMTAETGGDHLWSIQLESPRETIPGDNPKANVGDIVVEFVD